MNGPVAKAGSILYLSKVSGINVPNKAAKMITDTSAILSVMLNKSLLTNNYAANKIMFVHIIPLTKATPSSLISLCEIFPKVFVPPARLCTTIAAD